MNAPTDPAALQTPDLAHPRARIEGAVHIPLALIRPNPWNRKLNEKLLPELADSVAKHGVLQPIIVRPVEGAAAGAALYEIVAGERRWRASQMASCATVPCLLRPMTDDEVIELMLIENLQREDLHPLDEAEGYARLLRQQPSGAEHQPPRLRGYATVDELAQRIGKSKRYVFNRLKLLSLTEAARLALTEGDIDLSVAQEIARLPTPEQQQQATKHLAAGWGGDPYTFRAAREYIHRAFFLALDKAIFKITDETLVPAAGSCRSCPKRTGAAPDLFEDVKKADTCTDGACYQAKEEAHRAAQRAEAQAKGMEVISGNAAKKIKPHQHSAAKGYLELDATHHQLDDSKSLRKLLGKADVKPVLVEDPHTKALVEMVPEKEALAALKAAGLVKTAKMPSTMAGERAQADKARRETAWRMAVASACLDAARTAGQPYREALIGRVAVLLWNEMHHDTRQRITKLLGWPPLKARWSSGPGITAEEHIAALSDGDLCRYLTAATLAGDVNVPAHATSPTAPAQLLATAATLAVDVAGIKDQVRQLHKHTPDQAAAARKVAKAKQLTPGMTPETALASALKTAARKAGKAPDIKYRCAKTGMTWSGRGLQPAWLKAALADGATLQSFLLGGDDGAAPATTKPASVLSAEATDPFRTQS